MWILGTLPKEMAFIYLPGLLAILVAVIYPDLGELSVIYAVFATALIDSGHVYTTAWRTLLHTEERRSSLKYWLAPVIIFLLFSSWYYLKVPGLWKFVVYATLFHHVRQVYGFSKWYQLLNKRVCKVTDYLLYLLAILPIAIYHFRSGVPANYYSESDLLLFPNESILTYLTYFYLVILTFWIFHELSLFRKGIIEINRLLSIAYPTLIYGICFLFGSTITQVLFPLLLVHGIAYCAVMGQTLVRTQSERYRSFLWAMVIICSTAIIFGLGEAWVEENIINFGPVTTTQIPMALLIGLYLTPLFSHYVFDSWIWRKRHRDSELIFRS